jgi:hypothetical protein
MITDSHFHRFASLICLVPLFCLDGATPLVVPDSNSSVMESVPATSNEARGLKSPLFQFQENLRWTVEAFTRVSGSTIQDSPVWVNNIGLDLHKVFSGSSGDIGTLTLQFALMRFDNLKRRPYWIEDEDDWEWVTRISNFNFTGLSNGQFNIRAGHIEIPFGLEVPINSNSTLRQLSNAQNLGIKADWGVGFNGTVDPVMYEVVLGRGTGNEYHHRADPYVLAGRIGSATDTELFVGVPSFGVSGFYGETLGNNGLRRNSRVGLDAQYYIGSYGIMAETSLGKDEGREVLNQFLELNWVLPDESLMAYVQPRLRLLKNNGQWQDRFNLTFGARWTSDNHWALSLQFAQDVTVVDGFQREGIGSLQLRYRY